jgi:hypothetical protein
VEAPSNEQKRRGATLVTLELSERQAEILKDVLDLWIEGYEAATNDVINDRSLDSAEEMLEAVDGIRAQFIDAVDIRQHLWMAMS